MSYLCTSRVHFEYGVLNNENVFFWTIFSSSELLSYIYHHQSRVEFLHRAALIICKLRNYSHELYKADFKFVDKFYGVHSS